VRDLFQIHGFRLARFAIGRDVKHQDIAFDKIDARCPCRSNVTESIPDSAIVDPNDPAIEVLNRIPDESVVAIPTIKNAESLCTTHLFACLSFDRRARRDAGLLGRFSAQRGLRSASVSRRK
jgi:hypothetical protein